MEDKLLTIEEVAKKLQVSRSYLYKKAKAKIIPHFRIGATVRFSEKELEGWLKSHHIGGCLKI